MKIKLNGELAALKHLLNKENLLNLIKELLNDNWDDDKTYDDYGWSQNSEIQSMRLKFNIKSHIWKVLNDFSSQEGIENL